MMSCIAALSFGGKWKISDDKIQFNSSFPKFFQIINKLGANIKSENKKNIITIAMMTCGCIRKINAVNSFKKI